MLRTFLQTVFAGYSAASRTPIKQNPLAQFIRNAPANIATILPSLERYKVDASPGAGNWAAVPWLAVFDVLVTETAQAGHYPVYLFRADMAAAFLSLNQGVTDVIRKYKADARSVLAIRAQD